MSNPTAAGTEVETPRSWGRWLHDLFEASLLVKGLLAAAESAAGLGLLLLPNHHVADLLDWLTRYEITQDRHEWLVHLAQRTLEGFSIETQHFYAYYLLAHGVMKLAMVFLLARKVSWAYPAAMVMLVGFIFYQMQQWTVTHSTPLLFLSAFDVVMILLVWREYRAMRAARALA